MIPRERWYRKDKTRLPYFPVMIAKSSKPRRVYALVLLQALRNTFYVTSPALRIYAAEGTEIIFQRHARWITVITSTGTLDDGSSSAARINQSRYLHGRL